MPVGQFIYFILMDPSNRLKSDYLMIKLNPIWIILILYFRIGLFMANDASTQFRLLRDLLEKYDKKIKPTWDFSKPINVTFSMDLYQILELNEPQQYVLLNAWIIERWNDEFLYWRPIDYDNITQIRLPYNVIWMPDTTLYNTLVMKDEESRRLLNAKLTTNETQQSALIEMLYPTIYKFSCLLNLRFFPFDIQICTMTFSSWTSDKNGIDYFTYSNQIGTTNYLENEGWSLIKTSAERREVKYNCCPNNYTLLNLTVYLRRKPLFYIVNLIIPTSIITLIAIVGFFTTSSASGIREEKITLGITTLLSMSILMLMVSDQMPTTSTFIPLIGWFILGMIFIISLGTLASSFIIAIQRRGRFGERLSVRATRVIKFLSELNFIAIPVHLKDTSECDDLSIVVPMKKKNSKVNLQIQLTKEEYQKNQTNIPLSDKQSVFPILLSSNEPDTLMKNNSLQKAETESKKVSSDSESVKTQSKTRFFLPDEIGGAPKLFPMAANKWNGAEEPIIPNKKKSFSEKKVSIKKPINPATIDRINRQRSREEYEWLATIIERCCFIFFIMIFFTISIGINFIGLLNWLAADYNINIDQ